jgi:hypothetical protein
MKLVFWKGLQPAFHRTKEALYQQDHSALTDLAEGGLGTALGSTAALSKQSACPLYPQKQTFALHSRMSALGQKRTFRHSFDHLVRTRLH